MIPGAVRRWVPWLVLVGVALVIVVRSRWVAVPAAGHTVVRGELVVEVMGTGTLEARVKTTVSARIQERVAEVLVDEGDAVEAGQLLVRLDDAESRQQAAIAAASLEAARQTATRVRADLDRADAVLVIAEGLDSPNGVAFRDGALYVAEINRVLRFDAIEERLTAPPAPA